MAAVWKWLTEEANTPDKKDTKNTSPQRATHSSTVQWKESGGPKEMVTGFGSHDKRLQIATFSSWFSSWHLHISSWHRVPMTGHIQAIIACVKNSWVWKFPRCFEIFLWRCLITFYFKSHLRLPAFTTFEELVSFAEPHQGPSRIHPPNLCRPVQPANPQLWELWSSIFITNSSIFVL